MQEALETEPLPGRSSRPCGRKEREGISDAPLFTMEHLISACNKARDHLLSLQHPDGHWVFDLEADATIPAEYVLLQKYLGREIPASRRDAIGRYLRAKQSEDGGWPLFTGGISNLSASVKAYFALKLLGEPAGGVLMTRARQKILSLGGASRVNVFTRITLALTGQIPWETLPAMPVEIMLLPEGFFFNIYKVSYWSRTVIVPLLLLYARRPTCTLGPREGVRELFLEDPSRLRHLDPFVPGRPIKNLFLLADRLLKGLEPFWPRAWHEKAQKRALHWTLARMQGEGGLGGIFPAMANAVMALKALGLPENQGAYEAGLRAIEDLVHVEDGHLLVQPCLSPIWDTCLALSALLEARVPRTHGAVERAVSWLFGRMVEKPGDWQRKKKDLEPGGWAFQFENAWYPDVDDTSMTLVGLLRAGVLEDPGHAEKFRKSLNWVLGMQSTDGGWGAFDVNNNALYLNEIPFADHGALLDPSTSDLTGRCLECLGMLGWGRDREVVQRARAFLEREQEANGAWYGRWGVNYLYGTWSVLMGLRQLGEPLDSPLVRRAVSWLKEVQNADFGWGEACTSYEDPSLGGRGPSTPSQTAWALLGLMAAGEVNSPEVQKGIRFLLTRQNAEGAWTEQAYTGTGFPRVFYLRYHGYPVYFPLWALATYWRLRREKRTLQDEMALSRRG